MTNQTNQLSKNELLHVSGGNFASSFNLQISTTRLVEVTPPIKPKFKADPHITLADHEHGGKINLSF